MSAQEKDNKEIDDETTEQVVEDMNQADSQEEVQLDSPEKMLIALNHS